MFSPTGFSSSQGPPLGSDGLCARRPPLRGPRRPAPDLGGRRLRLLCGPRFRPRGRRRPNGRRRRPLRRSRHAIKQVIRLRFFKKMGDMCSIEMAGMFLGGVISTLCRIFGVFRNDSNKDALHLIRGHLPPFQSQGRFGSGAAHPHPPRGDDECPPGAPSSCPSLRMFCCAPRGAFVSLFSQLYLFGAPLQ